MSDHYAKSCQTEIIMPQAVSAGTETFAKSAINQMSVMCIDYITEQLSKTYMDQYSVVMEGKDRDYLRALAKKKCAEYLMEASKNLEPFSSSDNEKNSSTKMS